jgi:hypothetical protein
MSAALLVSMFVVAPLSSAKSPRKTKSAITLVNPQGNSQRQRQPAPRDAGRKVDPIQPERIALPNNLPNVEELRRRKPEKPEAPAPVPSTQRSPKKARASDKNSTTSAGSLLSTASDRLSRGDKRLVHSHHVRRSDRSFTPNESVAFL